MLWSAVSLNIDTCLGSLVGQLNFASSLPSFCDIRRGMLAVMPSLNEFACAQKIYNYFLESTLDWRC